jgi:excisionase family DNA binding protein
MSDNRTQKLETLPTSLALFTVAEAAAILGVSRKLISQWIRGGALPAIRLGPGQRLLRIRQADLEEFIDQGQVQAPQRHLQSSTRQEKA